MSESDSEVNEQPAKKGKTNRNKAEQELDDKMEEEIDDKLESIQVPE